MRNLVNMTALPVKDQLLICVTNAVAVANRYLEASPRFSRSGRLIHITCRAKSGCQKEVLHLLVHYDTSGAIKSIGDGIAVDVSYGEINYHHIHSELLKIIPPPDQA